MVTTAGVGWIVAAPKDQDFIWEGDKIVGHAKCLNEVFESDRLFPQVLWPRIARRHSLLPKEVG